MKKKTLAIILLVFGAWLCGPLCGDLFGQEVVVVTPGQIAVGMEIHFRFEHAAGGGAGSSYNWNFGDGSTETTNNNQAHHAFNSAGTFSVACMFTNMGAPPASGTVMVTVVDNRRISPQGGSFRQGKRVNFQAENFAAPSLRWDFGDGTVESGPPNNGHVYLNPGSYTVKAYDNNGDSPTFSECRATIEPDNRKLSAAPSAPRANQSVAFNAQNFSGGGLRWDFGDGTSENGGPNQSHVFRLPGNFQVRAWESSGTADDAVSLALAIAPDNRQLRAAPDMPRANQAVAFTAQNFSGSSLRWDFGDGTSENGGPSRDHVFRQPGNFQVRAWESSGTADEAIGLALTVAPDNRQVQANPSPPRAGQAVKLTASNFAGGDLKWSFGDGKSESGGPVMSHVYAAPGNVQVQVWANSEGQGSALKISLSVQPDVRQLKVNGPPDIFEGTEIVFEGRNFTSANLKWDFGDGTVERGQPRQAHRFQRPGSFLVKVVEADGENLPLEKRIQVLNDNRSLDLKSSLVYANSEFEIEARNFRGGSISWDFGDGPLQTGQRLMKHRYAQAGQYRVRAVDFAGRDGKFVEKIIQVENDSRVISLPAEIIAGEEIAMQLQNVGPGSFSWKFSDGDSRSGPELRGKAFRSPGPHKITVADPTGKFPPLEKTVHVLPDTRSLKGSSGFILPKEAVTFTAQNFRGPGVRWDFGDGTVKENGQATEKHEYAALGRYQVKAVDFNGRSSKVFSSDVVVADMTPGFEIAALEFAFDNGKYYRVVPKNSPAPGYQLRIKAKGRGVLTGQFMLDNMSIGLFQMIVQENQTAVLPRARLVALPMIDMGMHELTLKFTNYSFNRRIPVLKYFVTTAGVIQIVSPVIDAKVPAGEKVNLRWAIERKKPLFEIAVSEVPFQFLDDKQVEWLPLAGAYSHALDPAAFKPGSWIYWQVRLLNESKQVQTTSEIASFKLSE